MVDVLDGEVELTLVLFMGATIFGPAIGEDPVDADLVPAEEGDHSVVENIRDRQRRLARIGLGEAYLGVGVDHGLLVDTPNTLQCALASSVFNRFFIVSRSCRIEMQRTPTGETSVPGSSTHWQHVRPGSLG